MIPNSKTQECNSGPLLKSLNSEFVTILAEHCNNKSTSKRTTDIITRSDRDRTFAFFYCYVRDLSGRPVGRGAPYRTVSRPGNEANIFAYHCTHCESTVSGTSTFR